MSVYTEQLREAIDGVAIHSPTRFSWLSNASPRLSRRNSRVMTEELKRSYLRYALQQTLYMNFYMRGRALPAGKRLESIAIATTPFVALLSAANSGTGPRRELLSYSPGFYVAMSDAESAERMETVRLYWHLRSGGAVLSMRELTSRFNESGLVFQFKVLNDPAHYDRCDAGVLYFAKQDRAHALALVAEIYPKLRPFLEERTPAFAKPLAYGLGLAEDPGDGGSFGLHRCNLVAGALIDGPKRGTAARLAHCTNFLREHGVEIEAPYLNPASTDDYALPSFSPPRGEKVPKADEGCLSSPLTLAATIGHQITAEAIWFETRCNWVSVMPEALTPGRMSLEPDLYAGTAGIAWFLAALFLRTGEPRLRDTAIGAIEQSLLRVETHLPIHHWGLYCGVAGIAFTAVRVGRLLGIDAFAPRAIALMNRIAGLRQEKEECDLLFGYAGGVISALGIGMREIAIARGDDLLRLAEPFHGGLAWRDRTKRRDLPMTGFSHGAAGIGYALAELYGATRLERFRAGAEGAFAYERHLFDARQQNWADLRPERLAGRRKPPFPVEAQWCHGAGGIALSRLRAAQHLDDTRLAEEVKAGIAATRNAALNALDTATSFALCHGLMGAAEILCEVDPDDAAAHAIAVRCATANVEAPSLLTGRAGLGWHYLRRADPSLPAILAIKP